MQKMFSGSCRNKFLPLLLILLLIRCGGKPSSEPYKLQIPGGFPEPEIPSHNPLSREKVNLGRKLFFDPVLSADSSVSCGSCHLPQSAFANHDAVALGISGHAGMRNVPSLVNIAYHPYLFAEGEVPDLESQAIAPLQHEDEMGFNLRKAVERLNSDETYMLLFYDAFGAPASTATLVRALACYERTLISASSPFDQFTAGDGSALSPSEKRGMKLFFSDRTNCSSCHSGFNFTNYAFENIGLYETYNDAGKKRATDLPQDEGKFKTPSLRNVWLTWPYMHDGSLGTLKEVVAFYNEGGKKHPNKNPLIRPLGLSEQEQKDLVEFLESLTDEDAVGMEGIFSRP